MFFKNLFKIMLLSCLPLTSTLSANDSLLIGSAVTPLNLTNGTRPLLTQAIKDHCTLLVATNDMKFYFIHPKKGVYDFTKSDLLMSFAVANDMKVRGHTLAWGQQVPDWVKNGNYTSLELEQILVDHITTVIKHFATNYPGVVICWDVVNEAYNIEDKYQKEQAKLIAQGLDPTDPANIKCPRPIWSKIGQYDANNQPIATWDPLRDYVRVAFHAARQADPDIQLFYNDYSNEGTGSSTLEVYNFVKDLKEEGLPIDGIGMQCHLRLGCYSSKYTDIVKNTMQKYADLGMIIHVTELDVSIPTTDSLGYCPTNSNDLITQANIFAGVATACLQTPACKALVFWGISYRDAKLPTTVPGFGAANPFDQYYVGTPAYNSLVSVLGVHWGKH